ncbi:MAG: beta-propeller domain-containing protein [Candidatus Hydrogenedentes bacterium]|nr:beta-propeller domain-containing protein [Candidatus Hydrogenedentota bacterium]
MTRARHWLIFILLLLPLAGCPIIEQVRTFTSADVNSNGALDGDAEGGEGEGESPGTDNGGGEEREVVEPDVIRRVDNLLYVLNQYRGLTIVDLESQALLAQVPTTGYPRDLYFANGQAYVLVGNPGYGYFGLDVAAKDVAVSPEREASSRLYVVDVATPAEAAIRSSMDFEGDLVDSRLVGNILYAVTAHYDYYYYGVEDAGSENGTTVTSIDVGDPDHVAQVDALDFDGSGYVVHVNAQRAFVASSDWQNNETDITVLDITDPGGVMVNAGAVSVRGYVGDRFKLDEWNGALRVVSSAWQETNQVYVTTFDLNQAGFPKLAEMPLEGAEGETLFATRFDGARAYVVTYLVVDPLFVLDLSDPAAPALLGALEVPGYSTHIEPRGDRLIALGVDDTGGRHVSVSIFDVSGNGAPTLSDRVSFGEDWSWSNAYGDVKALTILDDVIIVPFSGWSGESGGFERLQFVSYTQDDLELRGSVDLSGSILRSLEYGAYYFGVTTEQVARIDASDLDNPVVDSSITIAENVVDYLELPGGEGVEIVERYDEGQVLIRTVDGNGAVLGEEVVNISAFQGAYPAGSRVALVGTAWDVEPGYEVVLVDVSSPENPEAGDVIKVNVTPYYFYYGYYYDGGLPEPGTDALKDVAIGLPYYNFGGQTGFVLGDTLALRCYAGEFDSVLGTGNAQQGLALINLETGAFESTVGLGYSYITSLDVVGDKLYLGNKESLDFFPFGRPLAACYIQEIDVLNGTAGPAANVPGYFVQYDPATDVLTLRDQQWTPDGGVESSLETVRWSGGTAVDPLDSLEVPAYTSNTIASGDRVYFDVYSPSYGLYQAIVGTDGVLTLSEMVELPGYYGSLLGAQGDDVFLSVGYGAIAQYEFSEGVGTQVSLTAVSGYPSKVRFGEENAYFPVGYYGLVTLPL